MALHGRYIEDIASLIAGTKDGAVVILADLQGYRALYNSPLTHNAAVSLRERIDESLNHLVDEQFLSFVRPVKLQSSDLGSGRYVCIGRTSESAETLFQTLSKVNAHNGCDLSWVVLAALFDSKKAYDSVIRLNTDLEKNHNYGSGLHLL